MRKAKTVTWVVYRAAGQQGGVMSVCQQDEWDEMEKSSPGQHAIVKKDIASEGEAEGLARASVMAEEAAKAEERKRLAAQRKREG